MVNVVRGAWFESASSFFFDEPEQGQMGKWENGIFDIL